MTQHILQHFSEIFSTTFVVSYQPLDHLWLCRHSSDWAHFSLGCLYISCVLTAVPSGCIFIPVIYSSASLLSHRILALKKIPSVSPSSLLSSPAYDEQRQALLRVLRVWHHNRRQAEAVADWGEGFNMLMHNSKNHIQGFNLLQMILLCIKNNVFFGLKTLCIFHEAQTYLAFLHSDSHHSWTTLNALQLDLCVCEYVPPCCVCVYVCAAGFGWTDTECYSS